jgi:transcriptional regulator with XRE-family HTH domain
MENKNLKRARQRKEWTQEETADRAKISRITYSRVEKGTQQPQEETIRRLCELFDSSREALGFPPERPKRGVINYILKRK